MRDDKFIFISYSSKDKNVADALCHYLEERGIPCWIAPRDILPGQTWPGAIVQAIRGCSAMVLIYTIEANTSSQVANEVDKAFSCAKTIIPFIVDSTPMNEELGYYLSRKHWLIAYPDYKDKLKPLADNLIKLFPDLSVSADLVKQDKQPENIDDRIKRYRIAAEQGDAEAQNNLGDCYYNGDGVPQDYAEAVKWYRKAAEQGNAAAQNTLGVCYYKGQGVPQNYDEAVKWSRLAAEQGHAGAQNTLGVCYCEGQGVPQNYEEAVKWSRLAAEQGYADAQCVLGGCYHRGLGVSQNYDEAMKWLRLAAEQGHADAQNALGYCYYSGDGVPQNYEEAVNTALSFKIQSRE